MKDKIEAKVFAFIPQESGNALILRRGKSSHVGVYSWDFKSDEIKLSQWLNGRIYEYRSDISPDGKYFIYSANQKGEGYTVISHAPWIKAISFWRNIGGLGGGIFTSNKNYILRNNFLSRHEFSDKALTKVGEYGILGKGDTFKVIEDNIFNYGTYHARLVRNSWKVKNYEKKFIIFFKEISSEVILEKKYYLNAVKKGSKHQWEFHTIYMNEQIIDKKEWEWCEWEDGVFFYSMKGCLYRVSLGDICKEKRHLIYDFNDEVFETKIASY